MAYPDNTDNVAADELRQFIERVERMNEEKTAINADISEIYKEAKSRGFDTKVMKAIVSERAKDANAVAEFKSIYELYAEALGMDVATRAGAR